MPFVLAADGVAKDDFWILESATLKWTEQTRAVVKGSWPAMRHSMAFVAVNSDTIIVFGGKSTGEWSLRPLDSDHWFMVESPDFVRALDCRA